MNALFGSDAFLYPSLGPAVLDVIRSAYASLLIATLVAALPHARRYFLSERWGGYAERGRWTDRLQNPVALPLILAVWLAANVALLVNRAVVPAACINVLFCRYFFIQMRWRGVLRGMGAPGFIAYWLAVAVLLLEYTRRLAPEIHGLALLALQVDFALIMLSAGTYKLSSGYHENDGMELGMVNPEWGYWSRFWSRLPPRSVWFRLCNEAAWQTEIVGALLMLVPPTRFLGGLLILLGFIFIATQIRLGFLCEMVIVCTLLFAHQGSLIDLWLTTAWRPQSLAEITAAPASMNALVGIGLWGYLLVLPFARAGLGYNLYRKKTLSPTLQRVFEAYTNLFGLIVWRVFSVDLINFYVEIYEESANGERRLVSKWGESLRYRQVAESIAVTSVFTTLKYFPSNRELFVGRLLRYARTVPRDQDSLLVFRYVSILKREDRFDFHPVAEYVVDVDRAVVSDRILDESVSVHAPAPASPIHEGARPGSYAPLRP
jgi:hypothetical protein